VIQQKLSSVKHNWAYFDIGQFDAGLPYLKFVNQFHPKFGDDSTVAAYHAEFV
jgi:hypothetical protein